MQYRAIPCNTMQYHAKPCNTMQYHAIQCNTMQNHAIPCNTMQYHAILCNTMQSYAIQSNTMQYHASLVTADGAYHCPVGSIMAIFIFVKVKIVDSHSFFFFSYWPLHFPIFFNFLSVTPPKTVWYHLRTSVGTLSHRISTTVPLSYTFATHLN